jgi:RNA polymerase sigma factor (sigma-70 family)
VKILSLFQTEEQLVRACQQGDAKAQRRLYDKYSAKMLGVCYRYLHDEFEAEEAMIEGFLKVFEKITFFKNEGSFEGWIRKIMVNESLMYLRGKKKMGWQATYEEVLIEPNPSLATTHLEADDLLKIIEQLPTGYKTIFNLYAIEGYSHAEIAAMLSISESTSKSQLSRARDVLKKMIATNSQLSSIWV